MSFVFKISNANNLIIMVISSVDQDFSNTKKI